MHPELGSDDTRRAPLDLDPGTWRLFADFMPTAHGENLTLGADLAVPGEYAPAPLPPETLTAEVDGYTVVLDTDVAIQASDLTLARGDLRVAAGAIRLPRRTLSTIKGNLFRAFACNPAAIPLAAAGLLNPMIAGADMAFGSVLVVTTSLRPRGFAPLAENRDATAAVPADVHADADAPIRTGGPRKPPSAQSIAGTARAQSAPAHHCG